MEKYDFGGWAAKNDVLCTDGTIIRAGAFKDNDGQQVPLVWNHQHNSPDNIVGHAILHNRKEGVYAWGVFNNTTQGQDVKELVHSGDINALSIYANHVKRDGQNIVHGSIKEVSLVLAGADPTAIIDTVMAHNDDGSDEEGIIAIFTPDKGKSNIDDISHADDAEVDADVDDAESEEEEPEEMADVNDKTVQDVLDTFTDEQKDVLYYLVGQALEDNGADEEEDDETEHSDNGGDSMKYNVFSGQEDREEEGVLTHADMELILNDAKRYGSLKESFIQHTEADGIEGGSSVLFPWAAVPTASRTGKTDGVSMLYPDAHNLNNPPEWIQRDQDWVQAFMNGVHHTPFSRIKSVFADITADEARAKGYIKGNMKKEEFFSLLKRTTTPTTIYKKQKMDRDDLTDITDFDAVAWIKGEMRVMLNEEIARACLIGDGRLSSSDDKINEQNIRPVWTDADLFTIKKAVTPGADDDATAKNMIKAAVRARKDYKGSGNPILFTTEDWLTTCLLLEDQQGYRLYKSESELASAMRVSRIITVPVMENLTRTVGNVTHTLMGIILNLSDYNIGADKGGAISLFDDFDIDYNQQKYLIETRCSGALTKPYSAIALELVPASANDGE